MGLNYGITNVNGRVTYKNANSILKMAAANGIKRLDTASAYGESEATLGAIGLEGLKVVTKLREVPVDCLNPESWVRQEIFSSLQRLGVLKVDGVLAHHPNQFLGPMGRTIYASLRRLQEEEIIGLIGISIYGPENLDALIERFRFELIQAPYNLLDRRIEISGWLDKCRDYGILVHGRSVFLQGVLLMNSNERRQKFPNWLNLWDEYDDWIRTSKLTPVEACLGFALSEMRLSGVVVGVDDAEQLRQLISISSAVPVGVFPNLSINDLNLIEPTRWKKQ